MRWFLISPALALTLAIAGSGRAGAADPAPAEATTTGAAVAYGTSPAYGILGRLPVMHEGRVKPLDTAAREEIEQIFKRETIKLLGPDRKVVATWTPVAAFLDWSVRPEYWNKQPIIDVEYLPLKQFLFAEEAHEAIEAVTSKAATPEAARKRLNDLAKFQEVTPREIRDAVRDSGLPAGDGKALLALAERMGEETKHYAPDDLMSLAVTVDSKPTPFRDWIGTLEKRRQDARSRGETATFSEVEQKALRVAEAISRFIAIRDQAKPGENPFLAMPRPANDAMIAFTAAAIAKGRAHGGMEALDELERESIQALGKYHSDIPGKDRAMPGEKPEFDTRFKDWARDRSGWVPVHVVRGASVEELIAAGFPKDKVVAYRDAWQAVEAAEQAHPGAADAAPMEKLIAAAHNLGASVNDDNYPSLAEMSREAHFNHFAPFTKAPMAYLASFLLLTCGVIAGRFGRSMDLTGGFRPIAGSLYGLGLLGLVAGIGLEIYGFYLRVGITGWAPVTNMYETVICVALIASVIGLIFELISRRSVAAIAGTLAGLLGTGLAASVPLLDAKIGTLAPVLRDNFWLTIHVLTIVSSYAPFTLAMVLGLIATSVYLMATYKRSAGFGELLAPLAGGIPLLGVGWGFQILMQNQPPGSLGATYGTYTAWSLMSLGGVLVATGLFATLGELFNRPVLARRLHAAEGGAEATTHTLPTTDPAHEATVRAQVMQSTAMRLKPMATYIYRAMQVGVLLVAAGTFLGGWWADKSWGRFWGWDPKEVWALITLLVYLMPLHGRFAGWVNTFWLTISSVVCFLSVLMAWYGVNFVLGVGLHSYGFGTGEQDHGQFAVGVVTLVVLAFAAGAAWRRRVSSRTFDTVA